MAKLQFIIAAPASGSGKTTVSRGLMAALCRRGLRVQPFKCGPDYIDTKFHEAVCGRPSVNLDPFMASADHLRSLYARYAAEADACVVEGMMGLFDGYDRDLGSTAHVARLLGLPVVLVVDARSAAYSTAALLQGFIGFRSDVRVAGVIFNRVGSARHEAMLRQVCADLSVECLGCLPRSEALATASRYLGLDFSQQPDAPALQAAWQLFDAIRLPSVLGPAAPVADSQSPAAAEPAALPWGLEGVGVALVARSDESFSFIYQETLDLLGRVRYFNPECDVPSLDGVDLLYLPGGYPERHAAQLQLNAAARHAIAAYAHGGGRVVAECGGMMYLCRRLLTDEGDYAMCGVLPCDVSARQQDRRLALGYRSFTLCGRHYRGHEFHYSQFLGPVPASACQVFDARGAAVPTPVFQYKNVIASYTHLYPHEAHLH